ncbi:hypothetical protein NPIL_474551 [Nephila pilipes]|uniref:Uncharacterized protein n=1 Tax=Nephila pilipes TaxID=299642 RepID=A0A8X6PZU1_NEPPI|nr:hypothetical protein NPIL_474551 [Nephila pilipes]
MFGLAHCSRSHHRPYLLFLSICGRTYFIFLLFIEEAPVPQSLYGSICPSITVMKYRNTKTLHLDINGTAMGVPLNGLLYRRIYHTWTSCAGV